MKLHQDVGVVSVIGYLENERSSAVLGNSLKGVFTRQQFSRGPLLNLSMVVKFLTVLSPFT